MSQKASHPPSQPPSQRKLDANRANAGKSTGPRTPEGKAASRNNAFKHGMYSRSVVAPGEDQAEYNLLLREILQHYAAVLDDGRELAQQLADAQWRIDRLKGIEAALFGQDEIDLAEIDRVSRLLTRAENSYHRAFAKLQVLKKSAAREQEKEAAKTPADTPAEPPRKNVLYWRDLKTGEPVLAPGFTEDGPIDYRKPENRPPDY